MGCQLRGGAWVDGALARAVAAAYTTRASVARLPAAIASAPLLGRLGGWLLPPRCVLCLDPGQPPTLDLCAACERDFPRNLGACPRCAMPMGAQACERCAVEESPFDAALVPYRYDWPLDAVVRSFKYHGELAFGRVLAQLLATAVLAGGSREPPDLLVPVPLHPERERERGYNQSWELARVLGRRLGVPVAATACRRTRATVAQAGLAAEARGRNVHGAFAVESLAGAGRIALVDDVMTTGATLGELARAVRAAGAQCVEAWAVARA